MQTYLKTTLMILVIFPLLIFNASADFDIENGLFSRDKLTEGLNEDEKQLIGNIADNGKYDGESALKRIMNDAFEQLGKTAKAEYLKCVSVIAISLCTALSLTICGGQKYNSFLNIVACAGVSVIMLGTEDTFFSETMHTLHRLSDYSKAALPVVCTAAAAGGAVTSSSAKYAACCLGLDIMITASERLIIPLINAFTALSLCGAICDYSIIRSLARFAKWSAMTLMSIITLAFTVYLSISGIITGAVDAAAVKTAKTVISTALPVVGGMISDSASAVLAAASLIRNTAGVFGLIAACAVCASPILKAVLKMLMIKLTGAVSDLSGGTKLPQLLNDIGTAAGMLAGLTGAFAIMVFISFTSMLRAVL